MLLNKGQGNAMMLAVLTFSNVMFAFILLVRLRTTPAEVLERLQQAELNVSMEIGKVQASEKQTVSLLDGRRLWMSELTETIRVASTERWRSSDETRTWKQIFEANPHLVKPDEFLPDVILQKPLTLPEIPK